MKTKERTLQTGEVFTPNALVKEMIAKIPLDPDKTYLDNSCGNGQFLSELLKQGIPIHNIYGVDLMADNVCDTIARLYLFLETDKDSWTDSAEPLPELNHPGHSDDHDWNYLNEVKAYQRDYNGISVRFSHFNKGHAGVFEYSYDQKTWTKVFNIVCYDALKYDYEFDGEVQKVIKNVIEW